MHKAEDGVLRAGFWPEPQAPAEDEEEVAASEFSVLEDEGTGREAGWKGFSEREIAERIGKAKKNSAPGPDGVSWEALKMIMRKWPGFVPTLKRLFNACLRCGYHPMVFKQATTVVLRKPGKPDYSVTGAYRPIALLNTMGKLLEALISARILAAAEHEDLQAKSHYGGRPHRSTEDALLRTQQFVADNHRAGRHVLFISADVSGAYNGVVGGRLARDLNEAGWPREVVAWATSFMKDRTTEIRLGDFTSRQFELPEGLPQGSPISQLLWLAYSRELADAAEKGRSRRTSLSIAWVDDVNAAFAHSDIGELQRIGQEYLDAASDWAWRHTSARFDLEKTGCCLISRPRRPVANTLDFKLQGRAVPRVDHINILGLTFQSDNKFNIHAGNVIRKATQAVQGLMGAGNRAWGFSVDAMRQLYTAGALPKLLYAASAWIHPQGTRTGSGHHIKSMARVQRLAALRITGAFKSTSTEVLDFEAGLPPLDLKIFERQQHTLIRLLVVPASHPLVVPLERAKKIPVKKYPGPLHLLLAAYPESAQVNIRRRLIRTADHTSNAQVHIAETKEEAAADHDRVLALTLESRLHIYTDGSGQNGRFGAASIVGNGAVVDGEYDAVTVPLGTRSTVYRAETTAVRRALQTLPNGVQATVWSDSQAMLRAIRAGPSCDADIRLIHQELSKPGRNVELRWVPGHMGIAGNEAADGRAKEAAAAECEEEFDEVASLRLAATRNTMRQWQERWDKGVKGKDHRKVNLLKVGGTRRLYRGLARATVSIIVQLRTGHIGLNKYLRWRRISDDARCDRCHKVETREHLLLDCCRTRRARAALRNEVGQRRASSTRCLLNDRDLIVKTASMASARFTAYRSEHTT